MQRLTSLRVRTILTSCIRQQTVALFVKTLQNQARTFRTAITNFMNLRITFTYRLQRIFLRITGNITNAIIQLTKDQFLNTFFNLRAFFTVTKNETINTLLLVGVLSLLLLTVITFILILLF